MGTVLLNYGGKSCNLLFASWRTRKADSVIPSDSKENQQNRGYKPQAESKCPKMEWRR